MGSSVKLDAIEVLDAPTTLSRKAMGSSVKLHAIEVTIFSAGDLRDADMMLGTGTSDPYCVCKIRGKPDSRFQTRVINDNCHPVWNYHRVVEDFEEGDVLEFVVFDRDMPPKEDDLLGSVDMESHMHFPQGFDGVLDLTVPKHFRCHDRSTLVVKVVPRDLLVEPEDDRAKADLQLLLDAGVKLWPELFPGYGIKLKPQGFVSTNSSLSRSASMEMYRERSTGTVHGTIITGHGRLERAIVMNPHGSFQGVWDLLSLACIFFDIFHVPFVLAFENETTRMKVANGITTGFWALDLLRSCFCGYYHDGIVEMRLSRIMTRYLKSWFLVDFVLVVMDIVGLLVDTAGPSTKFIPKMMRLLYVMRFVRVLSVIRIAKVVVRIERVTDGMRAEAIRAVIWLGTCMFIMLVGCHLLACGFYRLGHLTSNHGIPGWVLRENVDAQGWMYSYTTSVHWALTQFMPASSGINPGNAYERGYVLVVDVLGFVCFSFFVSNVQMQLQGLKKMSADSHQRNAQLRRFFTDHSISLALSQSIRCYINREDSQARNRRLRESEVQVLTKLPKGLQVQLRFEMYRAAVRSHPFFMGLMDIDMICFRRLCHGAMTEMALGCGEEVFVRGNKAHSMYFISGGRLLYKRPGLSFDINVGDWACEPVLWFPSWTHRGNLHTVGPADLVQVCAATFAALVFAPQASTVRRSYVQIYAAAFVRGGQSPTQLLHHSDLWGSAAAIDELVMQCMHQATSVNENRLADLWRETLAKESERL